jgi:3-methyladenine DNA glycosylase Mpg
MTKYLNLFSKDFKIAYDNITQEYIQQIAEALLNKYVLVVGEKEYRIAEVEFYIKNDKHNDKYTHGDKNQKKYGKWYFHRFHGGAYKSGTYKGLDLTLGNSQTCFGVLIRSIYDEENDTMIDGPCKSVNKILELNNCTDVKEFMENRKDPLSARSTLNFHLKRKTRLVEEQIFKGPRIGLSDKYPEWRDVHYRFLIKKNLIKKGKSSLVEV